MAISNLVSPGQASERPSVSAFFGQSYTAGATQKVSSTMMSDSFVDSTMNMLKGLNTEIARIQTTAKKTLAGFDKVINSIRDLNRNITMRFRTLNNELTASRVDFLRGVLNAPEAPTADLGGTPVLIMKDDKPVDKPNTPAPTGPMDIAGMLFDALGTLGLTRSILSGIASFFTTGALGPALLTGVGIATAFGAILFGTAALADYIEDKLGLKKKFADLEKTVEYQEQRLAGQKAAEKAAGGPGGPQGRADRTEQRANIIKKFGLKMGDLSQDPNNINIMVHKDGRKFDLTTGEVVPGTASSTPNYSPRATTPSAPDATSTTSRRKANLPQINQTPEPTGAPTPAANKSNFTPKPNAERNFTPRPTTTTGGASEGEVKAEQKKETGDIIMGTNQFKPRRAKTMNDDQVNEFEGFKNSSQKSLANQMIPDARNPGSNIDRGSADEFEIMSKLERGERVDPDKPPPTMTKRELASRIEQFGMPALAAGAYTPEEFKKITKQAGQYQWQSNAQEKAGEWIKNQSAEAMAKKSFKPLVPPVVMNNTSSTNNSSSSGGEGNNVAGQNLPLSATNPHIQEFLAKQNVQYQ